MVRYLKKSVSIALLCLMFCVFIPMIQGNGNAYADEFITINYAKSVTIKYSKIEYPFKVRMGSRTTGAKKVTISSSNKSVVWPSTDAAKYEKWVVFVPEKPGKAVLTIKVTKKSGTKTYKMNVTVKSAPKYTVVFKPNGGKFKDTTAEKKIFKKVLNTRTKKVRYGSKYGTLPGITKKGYTFAGWWTAKSGGKKVTTSTIMKTSKKHNLYAHWTLTKYTIKYSGLPKGATNTNKKSYTMKTSTFTLKKASCAGYDFKGWFSNSKKTKSITKIVQGSTGNKTIYSKWAPHKYTIKFDANGGTGTMNSLTARKYGTVYTLPASSFEKANFVFASWNTAPDGSGTAYANGAKVSNLVTADGGSITLYAQWKPAYIPRDTLDGLDEGCLNRAVAILDVSLPNCTTYALARALEITHYDPEKAPNYLPPFIVPGHSDAKYFWENNLNSANPYPTGSTPKVGAIAVWSNDGAGHVAVVEHIENGVVYYSHSNYGGFTWTPSKPYPGSVNTSTFHCEAKEVNGEVKWGANLTLKGYIYLPY